MLPLHLMRMGTEFFLQGGNDHPMRITYNHSNSNLTLILKHGAIKIDLQERWRRRLPLRWLSLCPRQNSRNSWLNLSEILEHLCSWREDLSEWKRLVTCSELVAPRPDCPRQDCKQFRIPTILHHEAC